MTIGAKIFAALFSMSLIIGAVGGYGIYVLLAAGDIVTGTYDGPLMATNYGRSASATFLEMDRDELRREVTAPKERAKIDDEINALLKSFAGDLQVAEERSNTADVQKTIAEIRILVAQWDRLRLSTTMRDGDSDIERLSAKILERFDMLIELIADHSFVERREAIWSISYFKYTSIAALVIALTISAAITYFLRRSIVRPLAAAAGVAERISAGELETEIPDGGTDETGVLLRTMRIMRNNIWVMMQREAAQRRSAQNRLVDALESSREGMVLIDPDGKIALANREFGRFFPAMKEVCVPGWDLADAFRAVHPELLDLIERNGEFQLKDGRWLHSSRTKTQDGGYFLFLSDFTEVKAREKSLEEAQERAEAANKAKSSFLANMSHELRTPLNAIIGFSEVLSAQLFGPLGNSRYNEYSGNILQSGRHLLEIINSVLDLSKSEAGKLQLNVEAVDIAAILNDSVKMITPQYEKADIKLEVACPFDHLAAQGDAAKLRQVFLNLLSNAVKFTEAGGRVLVQVADSSDEIVEVRISDTGIGIASENIALALAPFGQVDSRLARQYEGTGLGLPLSKVLVELHGGVLAIDSKLGHGTTVTVSLPLRARAAGRKASAA